MKGLGVYRASHARLRKLVAGSGGASAQNFRRKVKLRRSRISAGHWVVPNADNLSGEQARTANASESLKPEP